MTFWMSDNVVHLYKRMKKKKHNYLPPGISGVALCPYCVCPDGLFEAIVVGDANGDLKLRGLICMSETCLGESVLDVRDGILVEVQ